MCDDGGLLHLRIPRGGAEATDCRKKVIWLTVSCLTYARRRLIWQRNETRKASCSNYRAISWWRGGLTPDREPHWPIFGRRKGESRGGEAGCPPAKEAFPGMFGMAVSRGGNKSHLEGRHFLLHGFGVGSQLGNSVVHHAGFLKDRVSGTLDSRHRGQGSFPRNSSAGRKGEVRILWRSRSAAQWFSRRF